MLLGASSCKKDKKKSAVDVTGQWELFDLTTKSITVDGTEISVYVEFAKDNTFTLYQMLGQGRYRRYTGTWTLSNGVLSGKYSDKKAWGASYNVSKEDGFLILEDVEKGTETTTYKSTTIPSSVTSNAYDAI